MAAIIASYAARFFLARMSRFRLFFACVAASLAMRAMTPANSRASYAALSSPGKLSGCHLTW